MCLKHLLLGQRGLLVFRSNLYFVWNYLDLMCFDLISEVFDSLFLRIDLIVRLILRLAMLELQLFHQIRRHTLVKLLPLSFGSCKAVALALVRRGVRCCLSTSPLVSKTSGGPGELFLLIPAKVFDIHVHARF